MGRSRIQLCGRFAAPRAARPVAAARRGRGGRLLVALLATRRPYPVTRGALVDTLWPGGDADAAGAALVVLLSKTRAVLGRDVLVGRTDVALRLPADARVDIELAVRAGHGAESAVAQGHWRRAWAPALTAQFITRRPFLPGVEAAWADGWRDRLGLVHQRALASYAEACLGVGGGERAGAERAARRLVELVPLGETGYRLLMRAQAEQGDVAAALCTYERLRGILRDELGVPPGPRTQDLHASLLR
jgi:DNA-binding SARP family transcriptional activator